MKNIIVNAVAGLVALCGLIMLTGDTPDASGAAFVAIKICGGALLWLAYKAMERVHPEWEEEEV